MAFIHYSIALNIQLRGGRDCADSDVGMADDEFDDEEQDGVEPDLDFNEVVRTEAGERSGERLLFGEFYAPSRPPTAGGAANGLSSGSRAGSARGCGLMNAGAAGDAPLMRPVTPDRRSQLLLHMFLARIRRWTQT